MEYSITRTKRKTMGLYVHKDGSVEVRCPKSVSAESIDKFVLYKHIAENYLKNKTLHYADVMNVKPTDVKINSAKTRWGSCSGKNSINFSWKLIMADEKTVDYVVVHELAHTIEHNHSKKFWVIVGKYIPDYEMCKQNLKKLQEELSVQNWE